MQLLGTPLFLLSIYLLAVPYLSPPPSRNTPFIFSFNPPVTVTPGPNAPLPPSIIAIERLWPLYTIAGLALVVGAVLLIRGTNWKAHAMGAVALAAGVAAPWHIVDKLEIGKLINVDTPQLQLKIDNAASQMEAKIRDTRAQIESEIRDTQAKIESEIRDTQAKIPAGANLGLQYLGQFGFDPGDSDLKKNRPQSIEQICVEWRTHEAKGLKGLLLVIGATDRVPLGPEARLRYESNFGLARARAEKVVEALSPCLGHAASVVSPQVIALVSGPRDTPEAVGRPNVDFQQDRVVDVWAFWSGSDPR